jgi:hypothetical protein
MIGIEVTDDYFSDDSEGSAEGDLDGQDVHADPDSILGLISVIQDL